MNKINLENRVAIVTGGAQGFGLAITKRFVESGAKVLIWDKDIEYLNKVDLKNTHKIEVDVSNYKSIENAFGSRLMTNGFMLNNQLTDFSFKSSVNGKPVAKHTWESNA